MNSARDKLVRAVGDWCLRIFVTLLGGCAILVSLLFVGLMVAFWGNFNLANGWHLFVAGYTAVFSSLAVGAYVRYAVAGTAEAGVLSCVSSALAIATLLVWAVEPSRGLIH
jgi:hypothetical protein